MINDYSNNFKWFFGVVEDREDPKKLGRVRVRVHNLHSESKVDVPTTMLPWAMIIGSPTSAGIKEVGWSPTGLMVGTTVFGFFADGDESQMPMILGTMAGIPGGIESEHEVTQLARGTNNISKAILYPEPEPKYAAKYPYNKVMTTEGGHVIEIDDTPDNERIHIFHKSGTYIEIDAEGTRVDKTVGDHYSIMVGGDNVRILGDLDIEVNGTSRIQADGNTEIITYGNLTGKVFGEADLTVEKKLTVVGLEDVDVRANANLSVYAAGTLTIESFGGLTLRGGSILIDTPTLTVNTNITTATSVGPTTIVGLPVNLNP